MNTCICRLTLKQEKEKRRSAEILYINIKEQLRSKEELSEVSQSQTDKHHMVSLYGDYKNTEKDYRGKERKSVGKSREGDNTLETPNSEK